MTAASEAKRGRYRARGLDLGYLEWGAPDAPPLVMLHGGLENAHAWGPVAAPLAEEWRIIAPDLRGHGDSDWAPGADYAILDFVSDVAALFNALAIDQAALVGHSLGGAVATFFSALYPERIARLCNVEGLRPAGSNSPTTPDEKIAKIREWSDRIASESRVAKPYPDVAAMVDRLCAHDPLMPRALARHLVPLSVRACDGGYRWKYDPRVREMALLSVLAPEPQHFWRRVSCPTLLIYGAESWAVSPASDGRLSHFTDARVEIVEGAGHNVHHHRPAEFVRLLKSHLEGRQD